MTIERWVIYCLELRTDLFSALVMLSLVGTSQAQRDL
jgi:hypothetical protein